MKICVTTSDNINYICGVPAGIYRITNTKDGRFYIGSTYNLKKREKEHNTDLRIGRHGNSKMQRAYNKYGPEIFKFDVLHSEETIATDILLDLESMFIAKMRPFYNVCKVGSSHKGVKRRPETIDKIRNANTGRKHTDEARRNMSLAHIGKSPSNKGVPMSDETKQKVSESKKGQVPWNKGLKTGRNEKQIAKILGQNTAILVNL